MSENTVHNETPSDSDRMDISDVSDQFTPFSDQSPSETIDNRDLDANIAELDNVPVRAISVANTSTINMSNPLTTDKSMEENILQTTNIMPNLSLISKGVKSTGVTADENSCSGKEQSDAIHLSDVGDDPEISRDHSESKLSLDGLDLELPTLEMYQEEFVDFPSSPTHQNFPPSLVGERDSGNADGSEEEEDMSIYKAVLSPNCQDVHLHKEVNVDIASSIILLESTSVLNMKDMSCLESADKNIGSNISSTVALPSSSKNVKKTPSPLENFQAQRKVLTPNPEDTQLPDIGGFPVVVEDTSKDSPIPKSSIHKSMESLSGMKPVLSPCIVDDNSADEGNSHFVFERRDSKRLSRYALGKRVMEGLFVESRNKDSSVNTGLRKISVPDEILNSPELDLKDSESSFESPTAWMNETIKIPQPVVRKLYPLESTNVEPGPAKPVPASRSQFSEDFRDYSKLRSPPCPKPRRKNPTVMSVETAKSLTTGPPLVLNPLALNTQASTRRVTKVNPDGSVEAERPGSLISSQRGGRRRIKVTADILGHGNEDDYPDDGDGSSFGGRSSHLSDGDILTPKEDADLDALLSPGLDTSDELEDSILERLGEPPPMTATVAAPIPELTAVEERLESRNWRSCVVQGIERRIDMKVIEPYKRVLSHGGYLTAGSHNAIIVFSACFLPDRSRVDYDYVMDNLFLYVLTTLDQLITEDYVLIYLHGATQRSCMPTFTWLKRCYQLIDRRLRKNLKGLYLVHPTFWLKTIVLMTKPFISSKFSRKLRFVDTLAELAAIVPLEQASIPDRVKQLDDELEEQAVKHKSLLNWWWMQTPDTTSVSS